MECSYPRVSLKRVDPNYTGVLYVYVPWKKLPLGNLVAALAVHSHTIVSAPCSGLRRRSPILRWKSGMEVRIAGGREKAKKIIIAHRN